MNTKKILQVSVTIILILATMLPHATSAQAANDANIVVNITAGEVSAWAFQSGAVATLTIDDPGTAQAPDYTDSALIPTTAYPSVTFSLDPLFVLKTGFVIKVTDQVTTRQLIYREISISKIDTSNNIITGTAVANSWVSVAAKPTSGDTAGGGAIADKNGIWTFNFGSPYPLDAIQNGTRVVVSQYDDDYDAVDYEKMIMPRVEVALDSYSSGRVIVDTFGWGNSSLVTLKVDNPSTVQSPDFTFTKTASWDNVYFPVYPPNGVLQSGDLVTVEGNNLSTSYKVKLLKVTKTDVVGDFIGGIADPNQKIFLDLWLSGKRVTAETVSDSNGNWGVYFSSMMPPVDLVLGGSGKASVNDINGNATTMNISLYKPYISVDLDTNEVGGWDFQLGDLVTLTVDDPKTTANPDFKATTNVQYGDTVISLGSFLLKQGYVVKMFDSFSTRTLVVWDLFVTSVDQDKDRVYGFTDLHDRVFIMIHDSLAERDGFPDANGNWMADFADPNADPYGDGLTEDLRPGSIIYVLQYDDDYDLLWNSWTVPTILPISIDIKPGSSTNPINLGAKGVIPVAVLTTKEFNAPTLDPATVRFAGTAPVKWSKQDVDYDGDMDLLFHFDVQKLALTSSSVEASLTGKTFDGKQVEGRDKVRIVPVFVSYP